MSHPEAMVRTPPGLSEPEHPFIYAINTWAWLDSISSAEGRSTDLGSVPIRYWDEIPGLWSTRSG